MVVVRGSISDRPWGATLASIAHAGQTGQLDLVATNDQRFQIAFVHGQVVGAVSPLPVDSVARIALSHRLISAMHAKSYGRIDDVDRFVAAAKLTAVQAQHLKRRVLIQRVARTFAIDTGQYAIEERMTIPLLLGVEVDLRAAIYLGIRMNLSAHRLTRTMHRIGATRFTLKPSAINDLAKFELGDDEQLVIDSLHNGTTVAELTAVHREIDPRMVEALICSLALCDAVTQTDLAGRTPTPRAATITPPHGAMAMEEAMMSAVPMLIRQDPDVTRLPRQGTPSTLPPAIARTRSIASLARAATTATTQPLRTMTDPFLEVQLTRARPPALELEEIHEMIEVGTLLLERGVDHFSFLGLSFDASVEEVREAYLEFARYLRPEKLAELGLSEDQAEAANAVFAQVIIAHTILTEPTRRGDYVARLESTRTRARR